MTNFSLKSATLGAALSLCASPLLAQAVLSGTDLTLSGTITQNGIGTNFFDANNNTFAGRACIGISCDGTEPFEQGPLRLKWSEPDILFEDSSTPGGISSNDWRLVINDSTVTKFAVQDIDGGTIPFTIAGGVPTNTLWLASNGRVGLGTSIPQAQLDIVGFTPAVRMQQTGTTNNWTLSAGSQFTINDNSAASVPVIFEPGAPTDSLRLKANGYVGLGTANPGAPLTVSSADTFTFFRIEALGASPNTAADMTFTGGPNGNGEYRINVVDGDGPEMRVDAEGFVIATTGFKVGATTLTVPDYVFDEDYTLRPLSDVAVFIDTHKHLPDVPSATQIADTGLDMTEMQMALLKKVEELTLYAIDLEAAHSAQQAQISELRALVAELTTGR